MIDLNAKLIVKVAACARQKRASEGRERGTTPRAMPREIAQDLRRGGGGEASLMG